MEEIVQALTPEAFAGYTALGTMLIIPTVEVLRSHVLRRLEGLWVVLLAISVGALYGLLGVGLAWVEGPLLGGAAFGAWAGAWAAGVNRYVDAKAPDKDGRKEGS